MLNKLRHIIFGFFTSLLLINNASAQYLNYVDTTQDRHEITLNYLKTNTGYISCGTTYYNSDSPSNFRNLEVKTYDENFNVLTVQRFGDTLSLYQPSAFCKLGNNYYSGGFKINDTAIIGTIHKIDTNGFILNEMVLLSNYYDVRVTNLYPKNNNLYVGLNIVDTNNGNGFSNVIKLDTLGNIEWTKTYDFVTLGEGINLLDTTSDNGFILSTIEQFTQFDSKTYLFKLDSLGNTQWTKIFGGSQFWHYLQCKELPNDNYFCFGSKENPSNNLFDSWFLFLDSTGNTISDTTISFVVNNDAGVYGSVTNDGIFIVGTTAVGGGELCYLAKFDFNSNLLWKRDFAERTLGNYLGSHINLQNGFHVFAGWVSWDTGTNTNDEWFLVLDDFGCEVNNCNLSVNEPLNINTFEIYPNPASNYLTVNISDANYSIVTIYNSIGELVYSNSLLKSNMVINTSNFNNGIYFVSINSSNGNQTKKLIIEK